jgi:uracil-DNA glycosylase
MAGNAQRLAKLQALAIGYQTDAARSLARLRQGVQYVPGRGPLSPRYAFIGEAPGEAEDRLRRPFCGPSGRLLDELLASVGYERSEVYVTNVVKYRPPNNRDPLPSEKHQSVPYLRKELQLVAPMYVVTLGRHALEVMDPTLRLAQVHGQWQTVAGWPWLMPLYHPAVALYRSTMRATLFEDFARLLEVPNA